MYNANDEVIYVGMISDKKSTSLYDRMIGHGKGSHCREIWYSDVNYCKFCKFNLSLNDLLTIERLAIYGMGQPMYNDGHNLTESYIDTLGTKI